LWIGRRGCSLGDFAGIVALFDRRKRLSLYQPPVRILTIN